MLNLFLFSFSFTVLSQKVEVYLSLHLIILEVSLIPMKGSRFHMSAILHKAILQVWYCPSCLVPEDLVVLWACLSIHRLLLQVWYRPSCLMPAGLVALWACLCRHQLLFKRVSIFLLIQAVKTYIWKVGSVYLASQLCHLIENRVGYHSNRHMEVQIPATGLATFGRNGHRRFSFLLVTCKD